MSARAKLSSLGWGFILVISSLSSGFAQESRISVEVDREAISIRQTVRATVTIELNGGSNQAGLGEPSWSETGWSVLGRSSSTSFSFINGRQSLEVTKTYQLRPTREGDLKIGPFKGRGIAKGLTSNTVQVKVTKKPPPVSKRAQQQNRKYVQVKWGVDRREVWLGEPIESTLTVYVLNRLNLVDLDAPSINLKGFWTRELEPPRRSSRVELDGRIYYQQMIKRDQLTPLKAGELTLPGLDLTVTVGTQRLFSENHRVDVRVDPVQIKVKPLPPNPPVGFKGPAVGEVKLTATLDRHRIRGDESAQLIIKTRTNGMLNNIPSIELPYIEGVRSFPPTSREITQKVGGEERMVRIQTWLLKPERSGEIKLPSFKIPHFNPKLGRYQIAKSRALRLQVREDPRANLASGSAKSTPAKRASIAQDQGRSQQTRTRLQETQTAKVGATERLGVQLGTVLTEPLPEGRNAWPNWIWWLLGLIGPLTLLTSEALYLTRRVRERGSSGRAQNRAGRSTLRALATLRGETLDYAALQEALVDYLEARLQLTLKGLTRESLEDQLRGAGLSGELIDSYSGLGERIDFARFSPAFADDQQEELLRLASEWVKLTEAELSGGDVASKSGSALTLLLALSICGLSAHDVSAQTTSPENPSKTSADSSWAQAGNHAFWSGRYKEAVRGYQDALQLTPRDAGLWYNLGTAYANAGELGEAAYALERAALLAPSSPQVSAQRAKVHQAVTAEGARKPGKRRLILPDEVSSAGGALAFFDLNVLRALTLCLLSLACLGATLLRRSSRRAEGTVTRESLSAADQLRLMRRDATLRVASLLLAVSATLSGGAWWAKARALSVNQGIVIASRVALHRGPGAQYKAEVDVAGAVKLKLQGSHEGWRRVKLSDGRAGWLRDDEVRALTP